MAKRRKANRDEVMMIPFLDILCALIGVLILIIVVLCVAQTRQSNGRTPEEESLARKFAELTQMLKTAEKESAPMKTRLAELTATQAEARAREARLTELRKHLEMSGAEAKTNKEQATVLQKQVENQVSQIESITRQVPPLAKEIEALKKEVELRKKNPTTSCCRCSFNRREAASAATASCFLSRPRTPRSPCAKVARKSKTSDRTA